MMRAIYAVMCKITWGRNRYLFRQTIHDVNGHQWLEYFNKLAISLLP